jgi:hypothetical protein
LPPRLAASPCGLAWRSRMAGVGLPQIKVAKWMVTKQEV